MPTTLPPRQPQIDSRAHDSAWRGVQGIILLISLMVLLALALMPFWGDHPGRGRPWRVAILDPDLAPGDLGERRAELLLEAVAESLDRLTAVRTGLLAERAPGATHSDRDAAARARFQGADEALSTHVECLETSCQVELRRLRAVDGSIEWRHQFRIEPGDLLGVDAELSAQVHLAYLKFTRREKGAGLYCSEATYSSYLGILADHRRARLSGLRAAAALAELLDTAPRFHDRYLREAEMRLERQDPETWQHAADLLIEARRIAPHDVRASLTLVPVLLKLGHREAAEEELQHLEELLPGEPRLEEWRRHARE